MGFSIANSSVVGVKSRTYLFVDGANFRRYFDESTQKWFGQEVEFDFKKIKDYFQAEKAFYYDCIDDIKSDNETQKNFEERVNLQEEKLNKIREVEGCHVHLGSLSGKGKKKRQKEVDVLLAVQMMEHAFRGNMQKAVLLSGDKDFRPLVESLVRLGVFVEIAGDKKHISQDLVHAADKHSRLNFDNYYDWTFAKIRYSRPLDIQITNRLGDSPLAKYSRKGSVCNFPITLMVAQDGYKHRIFFERDVENDGLLILDSNNLENLILYFELQFEKINWLNS